MGVPSAGGWNTGAVYFYPCCGTRAITVPWGYLEVPGEHKDSDSSAGKLLGRSKLSDIVVNLPFVSRNHAVLCLSPDYWTITDLGSKVE